MFEITSIEELETELSDLSHCAQQAANAAQDALASYQSADWDSDPDEARSDYESAQDALNEAMTALQGPIPSGDLIEAIAQQMSNLSDVLVERGE